MLNAKISWKETKYIYDVWKNRVWKTTTQSWIKNETRYINSDYEEQINGSGTIKKIKYIFAFWEKFLTVEDEKTIYNLSDHLWWWAIDTNSIWAILQMSDYLPYWWKRVLIRNNYKNNYLFAWKELDEETWLQYFEARYYNWDLGRFYSQDRVFWELGNTKRWVSILADPQQLNSYAYARNNPVLYTDPSGEIALLAPVWDVIIWNTLKEILKSSVKILIKTLETTFYSDVKKSLEETNNNRESRIIEKNNYGAWSTLWWGWGWKKPEKEDSNWWKDKDTILSNGEKFSPTNKMYKSSKIYKEKETWNYYYRDPAGKDPDLNHRHLEVFNKKYEHLWTADPKTWKIDTNSMKPWRSIKDIMK